MMWITDGTENKNLFNSKIRKILQQLIKCWDGRPCCSESRKLSVDDGFHYGGSLPYYGQNRTI